MNKIGIIRKNSIMFLIIILIISLLSYVIFVSAGGENGTPSIKLKSPFDNKIDLDGNVTFAYNVTDPVANVSNCSLIINEVINQTDSTITKGVIQYFSLNNLEKGDYNWSINCTNTVNDENNSETRAITVHIDTTDPVVTLNGPADNSQDSDGVVELNFTVTDDGWITNCSLYTNISGSWQINQTNTFVQPDVSLYFTVDNIPNQLTFRWNIVCYDFALNSNFDWGDSNYTLAINNTAPILSKTIPDQQWYEDDEHTINLSDYFSDIEDNLTYSSTSPSNITVSVNNETGIVTLNPDINWNGNRTIVFYAFDIMNQNATCNSVSLVVEGGVEGESVDDNPDAILNSPLDNSNDSDGYIFFNCSGFDDYGLANVSLYTNISGTWELNQTKSLSGNYDSAVFNITGLSDGSFRWNCLVYDNSSNSAWGENRTVKVEIGLEEFYHDISDYTINHVDHNRTVVVTYSSYLNESLTLGDLTIYLSNSSVYYNKNMSTSSGFEINSTDPPLLVYAEKFRIKYNETHYGNFTIGNSEWLNITLKYYHSGNSYLISTKQDIEVKGALPVL